MAAGLELGEMSVQSKVILCGEIGETFIHI